MKIEELNLAPVAEAAARLLKQQHPQVVFTSGRRSMTEQASAMAANIINSKNRQWIARTYAASDASRLLQAWVDHHPQAKTKEAIAAGLLTELQKMPPAIAGQISKHLSGLAFDVQPVALPTGNVILRAMRALPGVTKVLTEEGGLVRWHVQF